jgi:putative ABC transport system permease protein
MAREPAPAPPAARPPLRPGAPHDGSRSRLTFRDLVSQSLHGIRFRRARAALTATGIAVGIAAMVAVVGISASSRAALLAELDELGTGLLQVRQGTDMFGEDRPMPPAAADMIRRIGPVEAAAATRATGQPIYRSDLVPRTRTGGLAVLATEPDLPDTLDVALAQGTFLDAATGDFPVTVLGAVAAERLGIHDLAGRPAVQIGGERFVVIGILEPTPLSPDIDRSALVGYPAARQRFGIDEAPSTVRVRTDPDHTEAVWGVLARTANPEAPNEVQVTRPSDALAARAKSDDALTALLLGLGLVALVVGGVGIANVMVISVLERRSEIGVRRALGATRAHVRHQFLLESMVLAGLGGGAGVFAGAAVTAVYAQVRGWPASLPPGSAAAGLAAALVVGALAGIYPAVRASRLAPADAVTSA